MCVFDIALVDQCVAHGRIYLFVPEQALNLFDGHPLVDGPRRQRPPETMWVDIGDVGFLAEFAQHILNPTDVQSLVRCPE